MAIIFSGKYHKYKSYRTDPKIRRGSRKALLCELRVCQLNGLKSHLNDRGSESWEWRLVVPLRAHTPLTLFKIQVFKTLSNQTQLQTEFRVRHECTTPTSAPYLDFLKPGLTILGSFQIKYLRTQYTSRNE